jgi:hypothetical protein
MSLNESPVTEVIYDDPSDNPPRDCVEFRLVYWDTTLKAAGSGKESRRPWEKHSIRRYFSSQLETLWNTNLNLQWFDLSGIYRDKAAKVYERGGVEFVPLVVEYLGLVCELDITFLRPGIPGSILTPDGGDVDNRIKVLFDALRVPEKNEPMPLREGEVCPKRIYCLMENDKLITKIKVTTDRLLVAETDRDSEACLVLHVNVKGVHPKTPYEFKG